MKFSRLFSAPGLLSCRNGFGVPRPSIDRMDLAQRIAHWKEQPPEQLLGTGNRLLVPLCTALLIIGIAWQLAGVTWILLPGERLEDISSEAPRQVVAEVAAAPSRDYSALIDAHLFGTAPEAPVAAPTSTAMLDDAPETSLSIKLTGVQAYPDAAIGQAIIDGGRGQEKTYQVGDQIDGASGATLHAVLADRVILSRAGRLETLRLPREPSSRGPATASSRVPLPTATAAPTSSIRDVISENASRITDIIRVAPHLEGGQMIGFRINPGRDRSRFEAFGFQPGDVVVDVNGTVLDDPSRGLQIFEALGEATQASVTVLREGTPQVLTIDTTQMESAAEGLQ